ncbi:MAG TPA: FAD binding domain-containing protein [Xanthobacteraceae bacterium]|jgi:carbon-monoxide dehydrogenase medium subunit
MKPVAFDYARPASIDAAIDLLGEEGLFCKALAGSQSLGPMLNLRLAQPDRLVDITSVPELTEVRASGDHIEIGACITHADIEDGRVPDPSNGLLPHVAGTIAYRAVRNRGTVGGSLAHADPAADWISILPLLGTDILIAGRNGARTVPAGDLMVSSFTTVLRPDELIRAIRMPKLSQDARWGVFKFAQKAGEYAHAIGGVLHDPERKRFRAVIGAIETAPIVLDDASEVFRGPFGPDLPGRMDRGAVLRLLDEQGVTDDYLRQLAPVALERAAKQACAA